MNTNITINITTLCAYLFFTYKAAAHFAGSLYNSN